MCACRSPWGTSQGRAWVGRRQGLPHPLPSHRSWGGGALGTLLGDWRKRMSNGRRRRYAGALPSLSSSVSLPHSPSSLLSPSLPLSLPSLPPSFSPLPPSLQVNIHQKVEWLQTPAQPVPNKVELDSWMVEGEVSCSCLSIVNTTVDICAWS